MISCATHTVKEAMSVRDSLLVEYDHEVATTRKLLERIPQAQLSWKPHVRSMSIGGLGQHLANLPNWGSLILDRLELDLSDLPTKLPEPESTAGLVSAFDVSRAGARKALDKTDAELAAMWRLKQDGRELFAMPRMAAFRGFVLNHLIHHRGQLSVYLRLLDVAVPAIYGPSADEG